MIAGITRVQVQAGKFDEFARTVQENESSQLRAAKGFKSLTILGDRAQDEVVVVQVWESQADLGAWRASPAYRQTTAALAALGGGQPMRHSYEVILQI